MLCYKDMMFCTFLECKNVVCVRRLTEKVRADAQEWWNRLGSISTRVPIAIFDRKPSCYQSSHHDIEEAEIIPEEKGMP